MAGSDPTQEKFEAAIGAAAPFLDLVLAVGERISRVAEPVDYEYYPIRGEGDDPAAADGPATGLESDEDGAPGAGGESATEAG